MDYEPWTASSLIFQLLCTMSFILFDNSERGTLYPFTFTKAIADLRFGLLSIRERWELLLKEKLFIHTENYLKALYHAPEDQDLIWIDATVLPDTSLIEKIFALQNGQALQDTNGLVAGRSNSTAFTINSKEISAAFTDKISVSNISRIKHSWQLMQWNDKMIRSDFKLITESRKSQSLPSSVNVLGEAELFIEEGARLQYCTLNASTGPIYIGRNAEIMEGSSIRGPFSLGENSVVKMNSRIYGATSLGPNCMGGGEIKNSVIMGNSNKAHDGYLGDSVVGEWCNFGAGSTNSNVKNTASDVKLWDIYSNQYKTVGQKCGVIMGDYSRVAINSSINTGSMIGVCCNVFGSGLLPTIITNFSWSVKGTKYVLDKAKNDINNWKKMKGQSLSEAESSVLQYLFEYYS